MKTRMLFAVQNLKRNKTSVALLERLHRLSPDKYAVDLLVLSRRNGIADKLAGCLPVGYEEMYGKLPTHINILKGNINYIENQQYDIAASFSDGAAADFVAKQVRATKKYLFLFGESEQKAERGRLSFWAKKLPMEKRCLDGRQHSDSQKTADAAAEMNRYAAFDQIYAADFAVKVAFLRKYPALAGRVFILPETIHWERVERLAGCRGGFADTDFDGVRILTVEPVGMRGHFDLALAAAKVLKQRGFCFRWYLIGGGVGRLRLQWLARSMGIGDCVCLLGERGNPYPYIGQCDLYAAIGNAQRSVVGNTGNAALGHVVDGYAGIEGALLLGKRVVATDDVQTHCRMLEWEEDALLVEPLPRVFADAVEYMMAEQPLLHG